MNWVPSNDFENEVVSQQPDHNFIFGSLACSDTEEYYPRPESHLLYAEEKRQRKLATGLNPKLDIIAKVQRIAGTKPLGQQPTINDWDDDRDVEHETIAMMRSLGINSSIEQPLDEKCTVSTLPNTEEMHVMHNGKKRMPIFYHDKFFKLKPRISNVSPSGDSTDSMDDEKPSVSTPNQSLNSSSISTSVDESYKTANTHTSFNNVNSRSNNDLDRNRSSENWRVRSPIKINQNYENWRVRSPTRSSNSQNTSSTTDSMSEYPPLPTKSERAAKTKPAKPERFYTAKELYKKNRLY